jgi:transglutaminase-like putative cysteine protease
MMEAARYRGFGARFVTVKWPRVSMAPRTPGRRSTSPAPGWRGFDPTNNKLVSSEHIPVAVSREQEKASPLSGSSGAFDRMTVSVQVVEAP